MKKIILLGLTVIGIGAAGASAQAGGFSLFINAPVPVCVPPVPRVVVSTGCYGPVVAGGYYAPGYRSACYVPGYYRGYPYNWHRGSDRVHDHEGWGHGDRGGHFRHDGR